MGYQERKCRGYSPLHMGIAIVMARLSDACPSPLLPHRIVYALPRHMAISGPAKTRAQSFGRNQPNQITNLAGSRVRCRNRIRSKRVVDWEMSDLKAAARAGHFSRVT